jgi:hypothetical protein
MTGMVLGIPGLFQTGVGRVGILALFLTLGVVVSAFSIKYDVVYRFVIYSLHNVEVNSFNL